MRRCGEGDGGRKGEGDRRKDIKDVNIIRKSCQYLVSIVPMFRVNHVSIPCISCQYSVSVVPCKPCQQSMYIVSIFRVSCAM